MGEAKRRKLRERSLAIRLATAWQDTDATNLQSAVAELLSTTNSADILNWAAASLPLKEAVMLSAFVQQVACRDIQSYEIATGGKCEGHVELFLLVVHGSRAEVAKVGDSPVSDAILKALVDSGTGRGTLVASCAYPHAQISKIEPHEIREISRNFRKAILGAISKESVATLPVPMYVVGDTPIITRVLIGAKYGFKQSESAGRVGSVDAAARMSLEQDIETREKFQVAIEKAVADLGMSLVFDGPWDWTDGLASALAAKGRV